MKKIIKGLALFLYCLGIMFLANSCISNCTKTKKYWNKYKCVDINVIKNEQYEYS